MVSLRKIPIATITLALIITTIQMFRLLGGQYEDFIFAHIHHGNWETFYNQPWRMLTSPFIHQNPLHYLENLVFLLLFGFQIERKNGWKYMLGVFFGALITGYVIYLNVMHGGIIGISGGVCGLFGFSLIANRRTPWWTTLTHRPLHVLYSLNLLGAVFADVTNLVPFNVAHVNHIVGILFGAFVGVAFLSSPRWRWATIVLPLALFASQFYSPWQLEWQLVQKQESLLSENPDCRLQSIEQEVYTSTEVNVLNQTDKPVALYWLDYDGHPVFILWLGNNKETTMNSWVGHPFCVVEVDNGKSVSTFSVTEAGGQTVTIR